MPHDAMARAAAIDFHRRCAEKFMDENHFIHNLT